MLTKKDALIAAAVADVYPTGYGDLWEVVDVWDEANDTEPRW